MRKICKGLMLFAIPAWLLGCGGGGSVSKDGVHRHSEDGVGTASLSWQLPRLRLDGSSLKVGELGSYRLRYGREPDLGQFQSVELELKRGQASTFQITGLTPGIWYFTVRAADSMGRLGPWSEIVAKRVGSEE